MSTIQPELKTLSQITQSPLELDNHTTFSSETNQTDTGRDENLAKAEIATLSLILIIAVVGNGLMLIALRKILKFRPMSRMYFFMLNLSIADLLVAFGNILPQLCWDITYRFKGPDLLCRVVKFLQVFVLYLSTYVLTSMAVDRYLVICHHNFSRNSYGALKGPKVLVIMSYIISFVLASPQAFIFSLKDTSEVPGTAVIDCWVKFNEPWEAKAYVTFFVVFVFLLPLIIIGFSYGAICIKVIRYRLPKEPKKEGKVERNLNNHSMSSTSDLLPRSEESNPEPVCQQDSSQRKTLQHQISQAKIKTLKLTLVVVICFFICWSPFCITQILMAYNPSTSVGAVHVIMLLLASLNSCTNPWIYLVFSESLCNQLRVLLGLGLKRGSDEPSIGDEAKEARPRPVYHHDGFDLPKATQNNYHVQTSIGRNSPPTDQCDQKPETKSDVV